MWLDYRQVLFSPQAAERVEPCTHQAPPSPPQPSPTPSHTLPRLALPAIIFDSYRCSAEHRSEATCLPACTAGACNQGTRQSKWPQKATDKTRVGHRNEEEGNHLREQQQHRKFFFILLFPCDTPTHHVSHRCMRRKRKRGQSSSYFKAVYC